MKFKILWMSCLLVILSFPSICFSEKPNPKIWEPLENNSYYNKKIITKSPGLLLFWTYQKVTDENRKQRVEEVKQYDLEKSIRYQNYHHEVVLWKIDCPNKRIMMQEFIDFDKTVKVLDRYRYVNSEWISIVRGSKGERLYQNVCTTQKKSSQKKK